MIGFDGITQYKTINGVRGLRIDADRLKNTLARRPLWSGYRLRSEIVDGAAPDPAGMVAPITFITRRYTLGNMNGRGFRLPDRYPFFSLHLDWDAA